MHIIRFEDPAGERCWGETAGSKRTRVLAGDLFGGLRPTGEERDIARLLAPLVPTNILCIGLNYREHARETGAPVPEFPVVFMKPTSSLNHPGAPIRIPASCEHGPEVDFEAELAVVIGRPARDVPEQQALDHVLGYTVANDVSARRWQKQGGGGQWVRGKGFDTFCPLGPALVTVDEIPDPQDLQVSSWLNGEPMQSQSTADMIFPVARLVSLLSRDTTLLPGTVILTGTPAGVGFARQPPVFLQPGDEIEVSVEGIGSLISPVL